MNNLEKLKEINPKLYEQIKLKYVTNAQNIKTQLDSFSLEECEEKLSNVTSQKELKTIFDNYSILTNAHSYVNTMFSAMEDKMNQQLKAIEKAREKLQSNLEAIVKGLEDE